MLDLSKATMMSLLNYDPRGGYQSLPDTDKSVDPPPPKPKLGGRRRCINKPLLSGIVIGIAIGWADSLYDALKMYVANHRGRHRIRHIRRRGPIHSGALHNFLYGPHHRAKVSIGPRPYFLINEMDDDNDSSVKFKRPGLKETLQKCANTLKSFRPSDFVLGHRGAPLQFPEHTDRSHDAATRLGAGLVECDINISKDRKLVCRHMRCDLHETTDVLTTPPGGQPFRPALGHRSASAKCCTTDFTLDEMQNHMCGRMSSFNRRAKTVEQYVSHTQSYRTDLYSHDCPRIQSHKDFVQVVNANGGSFISEFKMLDYDDLPALGIANREEFVEMALSDYNTTDASRVYPQSFVWEDLYYVANNSRFNLNTYALDKNVFTILYSQSQLRKYFEPLVANGVTAIAPAISMLLEIDNGNIVPSNYAIVAREMGLDIVAWSFERSDALANSQSSWYYSRLAGALRTDSDMLKVLDVLYEDVGISAIFTDWPSVVSFYANCKGIALH
ncbi:hypothetical protein ACHAXT_012707 [Thalassiosira profunda]